MLKDIIPGEFGSEPWKKKVLDDKIYFVVVNSAANDGEYFTELWVSDGTEAGTQMLKSHLGYGYGYLEIYKFDNTIYYQQANAYVDI